MTVFDMTAINSMYIIPGSTQYTLQVGIYTTIDLDTLDRVSLNSIQKDLGYFISSTDDSGLRTYLANKTISGEIDAESIQDLMAATLTNSVYDDEANTILVGGSGGSGGLTETQVNSLIEDALQDFTPSGGGGFSFGGDWDASGTISQTDVTHFEYFSHCEMIDETLTLSASIGVATVSHISQTTNATQKVRFTWPSTPTFFIGLTKSTAAMTNEEDLSSAFSGTQNGLMVLAAMGGSPILMYKYGEQNSPAQSAPPNSVSVGDIVEITLMMDVNGLSFVNVTENTSLGHYDLGNLNTHEGFLSFVVFTYGNIDIDFSSVTPLQIDTFEFNYPADITKTYHVATANDVSIIKNKLLKVNDFVDFITNEDDEVIDVVVSRLVSDSNISNTISTALNDPNSSLSNLVKSLGGTAGLDEVEYALNAATSNNPSNLTTSLDNFLAYLLNNNQSLFYEALRTMVQDTVHDYIQVDTQANGIIYDAIAQYVEDSTTGIGHATIQTAIENYIQNYADGIGVGANGQIHWTVQEAAQFVISNEIQSGGIIDTAIQAAINP